MILLAACRDFVQFWNGSLHVCIQHTILYTYVSRTLPNIHTLSCHSFGFWTVFPIHFHFMKFSNSCVGAVERARVQYFICKFIVIAVQATHLFISLFPPLFLFLGWSCIFNSNIASHRRCIVSTCSLSQRFKSKAHR